MTWTTDFETDALDEIEFERAGETHTGEKAVEYWGGGKSCNVFAFDYCDANDDAVVKVATVNGDYHAFVYDAALDVTIDATLGQFDGCASVGVWDGEEHPHLDEHQPAPDVFETREAFNEMFDKPGSPFYC